MQKSRLLENVEKVLLKHTDGLLPFVRKRLLTTGYRMLFSYLGSQLVTELKWLLRRLQWRAAIKVIKLLTSTFLIPALKDFTLLKMILPNLIPERLKNRLYSSAH